MSRDKVFEVGPRLGKTVIISLAMILLFVFVIVEAKAAI